MDAAAYARRQSQIHVRTQKEIARIDTELYGRHGPHPALTQVVPGKYYNRGDCSHIRCTKCGTRTHGERWCSACEAREPPFDPRRYVEELHAANAKGHRDAISWGLAEI